MNGSWQDYRVNQFHRQEKMRAAEIYRLGQAASGKNNAVGHGLAAFLANLLALMG